MAKGAIFSGASLCINSMIFSLLTANINCVMATATVLLLYPLPPTPDVLWDRDAVGTDGAGFSWHVSGRYAAPRYGLQPPTPALAVAWMGGLEAELAALELRGWGLE